MAGEPGEDVLKKTEWDAEQQEYFGKSKGRT